MSVSFTRVTDIMIDARIENEMRETKLAGTLGQRGLYSGIDSSRHVPKPIRMTRSFCSDFDSVGA
jgi:hypothetical protein